MFEAATGDDMSSETLDNVVEELNECFAIPGRIAFHEAAGGLIVAEIGNQQATARIALQGAQVLGWTPKDQQPVIWESPAAIYTAGKSVRGGVPVCWPWFGPHATESDFPAHGFARNLDWEVVQTQQLPDDTTTLSLRLPQTDETRRWWPHASELLLLVNVGERLQIDLLTRNTGSEIFTVTQALHTYFAISDVREVSVLGLEDQPYIDKVDGGARRVQSGPVTFDGETDRIYLDQGCKVEIDDPGLQRRICISRDGSHSTVVWNPWTEKSAAMADMGPDAYLGMLCVEATNAADDAVSIAPGDEHRLQVLYWLESL